MIGGEFSLQYGGVDDLERSCAITRSVCFGVGGPLVSIGDDLPVGLEFDSGFFQAEIPGGRRSAQSIDDMLGGAAFIYSVEVKDDLESILRAADALELRAGVEIEPFVTQGGLDHFRNIRSMVFQDVMATLNLGRFLRPLDGEIERVRKPQLRRER